MSSRFGPTPTQNQNNHISARSSTRLHQPPGGGSTMGSLIYGGGGGASGGDEPSYMDDRKARRFARPDGPEANPIVDKSASYYGTPTAAQRDRDNITMPPGAMSRESVYASHQQQQQQYQQPQPGAMALARRSTPQQQGSGSAATGDYFANGMGNQDDSRRTRRMYAPPGGSSSFQLG